jgi:O-antigen ligase
MSLARAAWLGLATAVAFAVVSEVSGRLPRKSFKRALMLMLLLTSVGLALWYSAGGLHERAESIAPDAILEDPTLAHRVYATTLALQDASTKLWLGLGTDSFELMREDESQPDQKGRWIPNLPVRVLHDTGIVGVLLFFGFFVVLMRRAWRSREHVAGAFLSGAITLAVAFQFSDASVLAYPWILAGIMAAVSSARPEARAPAGAIQKNQ